MNRIRRSTPSQTPRRKELPARFQPLALSSRPAIHLYRKDGRYKNSPTASATPITALKVISSVIPNFSNQPRGFSSSLAVSPAAGWTAGSGKAVVSGPGTGEADSSPMSETGSSGSNPVRAGPGGTASSASGPGPAESSSMAVTFFFGSSSSNPASSAERIRHL